MTVIPSAPTSNDSVQLAFEGILGGSTIFIDGVVVERVGNTISLVVSAREIPNGYVGIYKGTATVGFLTPGSYVVNFYTRSLSQNGPFYDPPFFAVSTQFSVLASTAAQTPIAIPTLTWAGVFSLTILVLVTILIRHDNNHRQS